MPGERVLILGAAGRDFHNFNVLYRSDPEHLVVGFTAAQIPNIAFRLYPSELAGPLYPDGIPIFPESDLERLIREMDVDRCVLAYSDLSNQEVMEIASRVLSCGADFELVGQRTMLRSSKPVVAVCAVRTGAGKSQTARYIVNQLRSSGLNPVVIRHPMPYRDLLEEAARRYSSLEELDSAGLTIEEREEYEAHIRMGTAVYAGVDYEMVLRAAEREADIIVWDGGNNDLPFVKPDLWITVADAMRPGHELTYYPGSVNFRCADIIVINKVNTAPEDAAASIENNAAQLNPRAMVFKAASAISVEDPDLIKGRRVLVIEDGPTLTHGGMPSGAGRIAAAICGASEIVDPRPFVVGSIRETLERYVHIKDALPALGYYPEQMRELEESINRCDCDAVIIATPVDLRRVMSINKPSTSVRYELIDPDNMLADAIRKHLNRMGV
ncbi:MAG TPA: cyclic 2,3-diphosphoglycerate synthase [Methanothrix sp.]|nr:cyclic 2,3-diphosphoglycerate synthase [Methanothrix sp.]HOK58626.1 cyclic 2,3-diphosphoglycerate synthase [Methanothrix sp.]HOL43741.1 cyclic 2,3-diphosphoglycerate synthase [Methanothrix sp.]HPO88826.1 cyclic 2,3-diphosphoglycerate synthase [Methanothrix sp.]